MRNAKEINFDEKEVKLIEEASKKVNESYEDFIKYSAIFMAKMLLSKKKYLLLEFTKKEYENLKKKFNVKGRALELKIKKYLLEHERK